MTNRPTLAAAYGIMQRVTVFERPYDHLATTSMDGQHLIGDTAHPTKSAPALAPAAASLVSTWQDRLTYVDGWEPLPEVRNIKSSSSHN
eukprot:7988272-Karenia_brevis.AAC.1